MFDMKMLYIATALGLLGGSAANAGTILDAVIGRSGARLKIEGCGTDTCGTISWGKQKLLVKKSDISSAFKDLDIGHVLSSLKPPGKDRGKSPATADRAKPARTAPAARSEDSRSEELAARQFDDRPAARNEEKPHPTNTAKDEAGQKVAVAAPAPAPVASAPNSPIGEWIAEGDNAHVQVGSCGQALCGFVSGAESDETDRRNPAPRMRNRPVNGMPVPMSPSVWPRAVGALLLFGATLVVGAASVVAARPPAVRARADDVDTCVQASDDVAIAECTRGNASGRYGAHDLATLHYNRAVEYHEKGDDNVPSKSPSPDEARSFRPTGAWRQQPVTSVT
jgi:Uncharacterized protein conserved in bacteria (DUF2147)